MKKRIVALIITILLFLPVNVFAEKLIFGTCEYPPRGFMKNGQPTGADVEIVREACGRLGIEAEIRILPWKRALAYAKKGKADAIFSLQHNEERSEFLHFTSEPVYIEKYVIIARKESGIQANGLDDLKDKVIGIVRGYSYGSDFDNHPDLKKEECGNDTQLIRKLDAGRTKLAAGQEGNLGTVITELGFGDRFETVYTLPEIRLYIGFSMKISNGKSLAEKFSRILRLLREEGVIKNIENKYSQ